MRPLAVLLGFLTACRAVARRRTVASPAAKAGRGPLFAEDNVDDTTRGDLAAAWRVIGDSEIARGIDGRAEDFTPPARSLDSAADVALALHDALVTKETSARVARRVIEPALRASLEQTSAIAAREAAHLTRVLERTLDGETARQAALFAVRLAPHRHLPAIAQEGGWERWGIAGRALEDAARAKAQAFVERRVSYSDFGFGALGPSFVTSPSPSWRRISS